MRSVRYQIYTSDSAMAYIHGDKFWATEYYVPALGLTCSFFTRRGRKQVNVSLLRAHFLDQEGRFTQESVNDEPYRGGGEGPKVTDEIAALLLGIVRAQEQVEEDKGKLEALMNP